MYAVIASGGKQYRVSESDIVELEKLEVQPGEQITLSDVLMLTDGEGTRVGTPYLEGVKVIGEVLEHGRHDKIKVVKFRRRKHHMKQLGHRQHYTAVKITHIEA